jgi:hypothetical protein
MGSEVDHAPELRLGAQGPDITPWVTYLQQLLTRRGSSTYTGPVDGNFTAEVEAAVRKVQRGMAEYARLHKEPAIAEDGVVTLPVWQDLYSGASNKEAVDVLPGIEAATYSVENEDGEREQRVHWDLLADKGHELGPGREIGRHGWVHGTLQCSIRDFKGDDYHGPVYVVFQATDQSESDEGGHAANGWCTISNIWMPAEGHLRIVLESPVGAVHGVIKEQFKLDQDPNLAVHVEQVPDIVTVSVADAEQHGWLSGTTVNEGVDFKVTVGPASIGGSHQESGQHQQSGSDAHTQTETVTVKRWTEHLEIVRSG